jgi:hypothetical protein
MLLQTVVFQDRFFYDVSLCSLVDRSQYFLKELSAGIGDGPPNRRYLSTRLHGVTSRNTEIITFSVQRNSSLMWSVFF